MIVCRLHLTFCLPFLLQGSLYKDIYLDSTTRTTAFLTHRLLARLKVDLQRPNSVQFGLVTLEGDRCFLFFFFCKSIGSCSCTLSFLSWSPSSAYWTSCFTFTFATTKWYWNKLNSNPGDAAHLSSDTAVRQCQVLQHRLHYRNNGTLTQEISGWEELKHYAGLPGCTELIATSVPHPCHYPRIML